MFKRLPFLFPMVVFTALLAGVWPGSVFAATAPSLGTALNFTVLAGSTITNTGPTVITGNLGLQPGSSVPGFPPGVVTGVRDVSDAVALRAKNDLVTADNEASPDGATAGPEQNSTSWAGYVVTSRSPFTYVSGQWTVPTVTCSASKAMQAVVLWVGLDGWSDKTVEQGGIEAFCSGTTPVYAAWWEMYPTNNITQVFAVRPGDHMIASVSYLDRHFSVNVRDITSGKSSTGAHACASTATCSRTSAEWIVEAPAYGGHGASLARWNQVAFTQTLASVSVNQRVKSGISAFANFRVEMTGAHGLRAQPGGLVANGRGFNATWISST